LGGLSRQSEHMVRVLPGGACEAGHAPAFARGRARYFPRGLRRRRGQRVAQFHQCRLTHRDLPKRRTSFLVKIYRRSEKSISGPVWLAVTTPLSRQAAEGTPLWKKVLNGDKH